MLSEILVTTIVTEGLKMFITSDQNTSISLSNTSLVTLRES